MTTTTKSISFQALVDEIDPPPDYEISYEWSNGRQFFEPFVHDGYGIYDGDDDE